MGCKKKNCVKRDKVFKYCLVLTFKYYNADKHVIRLCFEYVKNFNVDGKNQATSRLILETSKSHI